MTASFSIDHFVIAVRDLQTAVESYSRLGFTITPGGRHTHAPTQNVLICFADGAYLELIEWLSTAEGDKWYEALNEHGEGLVDFALVPSDLAAATAAANATRQRYGSPVDGSRITPAGQTLRWQLAWPNSHVLPFLCSDVTPRNFRVPEGEARIHSNGVIGVASAGIRVRDLTGAEEEYRALLEQDPAVHFAPAASIPNLGLKVLQVSIGNTQIRLTTSLRGAAPEASALEDGPEKCDKGLYELALRLPAGAKPRVVDPKDSHGVNLRFIPESPAAKLDR